MRTISKLVILTTLLVFLVGCQTNSGSADPTLVIALQSPPPPDSSTPGETMTSPTPDLSGLEGLIDVAKNDLAGRLSVSIDHIDLVEARPVVWPDSSLGCPQPGMAYLQIPEDGELIVLKAGEVIYEYHNGGNRGLFLCEKANNDPGITPGLDLFNLTPSDPPPTTPDNSIPPGEDT